MFTELKPFLDWLHLNPHYAGIATFLVTLLESLAIIGLFIPGTVVMVAIGSLIGTGYLPLVGTTLWAIAGALVGDLVSFWLGYTFHDQVKKFWPFRSHPKLLQKGVNFFQAHGGKSVFLGRFAGPVRPVLPVVAGMMSMPPIRFIAVDVISAVLWAPLLLLPGILLGAASQNLPKEVATKLILFVMLGLLILWCVSWLIKLMVEHSIKTYHNRMDYLWQRLQNSTRFHGLYVFLRDPTHPQSANQLKLLFLFLLSGLLFILLAASVYHHGVLTGFNQGIYHLMRSLRNNYTDRIFVTFSLLSSKVLLPMWICVGLWFSYKRQWRVAFYWFLLGILAMGATEFFKMVIHSPRPTGLIKTPDGWSFPSGHTTMSIVWFGFLAMLLTQEQSSEKRWLAYGIAGLFAGLILFSRVYLTAHWLTDVVGGVLLALCCIAFVTLLYRRKAAPKIEPVGVLIVAVISLLLSWGWIFHHKFSQCLLDYTPEWEVTNLAENTWWNNPLKLQFRTDRFGRPIQVLNLQWAGSLDQIEQQLTAKGWYKLNKASLLRAINALTAKNGKHSYYLEQLYQDRKAVLEMEKNVQFPQVETTITLRLWDSHYILDNGQNLWIGTIGFHKPWHLRFLKENDKDSPELTAVTDVLIKDLGSYQWKKIVYNNAELPSKKLNLTWDGSILLVK